MDECFEFFLEHSGPQKNTQLPKASQISKFNGRVPAILLEYWQSHGWGSLYEGLFWFANPDELGPVVDAWFDEAGIGRRNDYQAIARSAFGKIFLWDKTAGHTMIIDPAFSEIITFPPEDEVASGEEDIAFEAFLVSIDTEILDIVDAKDKLLFKRALKRLGPLKSDEMYGFEPAIAIGGKTALENLEKVKLIEHLVLLAQLTEIDIRHMDLSRCT